MKPAHLNPVALARLFWFLCSLPVVSASHAGIEVLDNIEISHDSAQSTIHIHLNIPVRYKSHAPEHSGDLLSIQVEPLPTPGSGSDSLLGRQSMAWTPDRRVPLFAVTYDAEGFANTTINLRFQKNVEFAVRQPADFNSIEVTIKERESGRSEMTDNKGVAGPESVGETAPGPGVPVISGYKAASAPALLALLMQNAREKMTDKEYAAAIRIYTKVLQYPENEFSQDALEFLGLARERNGQLAHAKAAYQAYLERYPADAGTERVNQRLMALVTARKMPREKLPTAATRHEQPSDWTVFGGFSQYYRRDVNTANVDEDDELTTTSQSSVDSNLDVTARLRGNDHDIRTRFTGGYLHDFLDNGVNSDTTVSSLYVDAKDRQHDLSMRLGRQSRSTGGVLGRFDGLLVGMDLTSKFAISAVAGSPVESSTDGIDTDRYFCGLTFEFDGFADGWYANTFVIEQRADSITDRRAVGGELRYFDPTRSFFSLIDYDIHHGELNIWQFLGNLTAPDKTTVNLVVDYRKSPLLMTSNALTGQAAGSIEELLDSYSGSEIRELANDRTATSKLATLGLSRPVNEKFQISADVTALNLSGTGSSGGVDATDGTGNEYIYNLQLIGSNLLKEGDITILGLRYIDADKAGTTSMNFNTRFPVTGNLRVNPRMRVDYRRNRDDDTSQMIYQPSVRMSYQVKRRLRIEAEVGGEWSNREIIDGSEKDRSYFFNLGYRLDF